ncbi:hypothetical protein AN217_16225 [Streptomyces qinglanensis]|uniref:Uncharacterized protein n=1 Tax=Streptomyces qinglanensis TaxID=943816 RepID=A0A1E7K592_9ACTN|nr:hypothetical protein AN217_16225 [Streptomyces qinglanensis]
MSPLGDHVFHRGAGACVDEDGSDLLGSLRIQVSVAYVAAQGLALGGVGVLQGESDQDGGFAFPEWAVRESLVGSAVA